LEHRFKLKNSEDEFILDDQGYEYLTSDALFKSFNIIHNFRKHSSGCAVYQKSKVQKDGTVRIDTFYLHKIIAEKFLSSTRTERNKLVSAKNGNKLDCRVENLVYRSREQTSRRKKTSSSTGYTGVYQEGKRYRVIISYKKRSMHLGMYTTKEEAALAYNIASQYLYGKEGKLNEVPNKKEFLPVDFNMGRLKKLVSKIDKGE